MFSSLPEKYQSLADETFNDPLTIATASAINWTFWLDKNFPTISGLIGRIPGFIMNGISDSWETVSETRDVS